jgi:hypothetical protein
MAKKTIYTNPPIERLVESSPPMKFSQRLGEVVERYELIMKLTDLPSFSDDEIMILSEVVCGSAVNATMVRAMHIAIYDAQGNDDAKKALADKIEKLYPAQRIKLIESLGQ